MQFVRNAEPKFCFGDFRERKIFCIFPRTYIVIDRMTNKRKEITFWLETITLKEELMKGRPHNFLVARMVNGQVIERE